MSDVISDCSSLKTIKDEERLYTVQEMADYLQVKVGSLKDWTKLEENPCPCYRYKGRVLRFNKEEVLTWFKGQTKVWRKTKESSKRRIKFRYKGEFNHG